MTKDLQSREDKKVKKENEQSVIDDKDDRYNYVSVNCEGALLAEGLENWVGKLGNIKFVKPEANDVFVHYADSRTGAEFLIKRIK